MKLNHALNIIPLLAALYLGACASKVETRGFVSDDNLTDFVVPGTTTKEELANRFGSPSSQSSFGTDTWYYISMRKETVAFFEPEVSEQHVVIIEFDETGIVTAMNSRNLADSKQIELVGRTTPTEGHSLGFFEQVVGNIGRFNKPGTTGGVTAPRPGSY